MIGAALSATIVLQNRFDPEATLAAIDEHKPSVLAVVPVMLSRILDLPQEVRAKYDTSVVPGKFFGMPENFRLGLGCESETFAEGVRRLGLALDDYSNDLGN